MRAITSSAAAIVAIQKAVMPSVTLKLLVSTRIELRVLPDGHVGVAPLPGSM
ncbi:hypothetical protein ACH4VM_32450 [Streptomyces sp. NPDC020792]|uniref:hypothetical protein n=1 Tax=Streptomyces sp. NPDC020792 TaxID=3365089 RepID=UPI0037BCE826